MITVKNLAVIVAAASCLRLLSAHAQTSATGSLTLNSLSATGAGLNWSGDWSLYSYPSTFASSTDGGENFGTTSASVLYANATSSGAAPNLDVTGLSGAVQGTVALPGGFNEQGYTSVQSILETSFTTTAGSVSVSFTASLSSSLEAIADPSGTVLYSDDSFNLSVDGTPYLFFSDSVSANPGGSASNLQNPSLTTNPDVALTAGTHYLYIELDTEQSAITVPDAEGTFALLLFGSGCLLLVARRVRPVPAGVG